MNSPKVKNLIILLLIGCILIFISNFYLFKNKLNILYNTKKDYGEIKEAWELVGQENVRNNTLSKSDSVKENISNYNTKYLNELAHTFSELNVLIGKQEILLRKVKKDSLNKQNKVKVKNEIGIYIDKKISKFNKIIPDSCLNHLRELYIDDIIKQNEWVIDSRQRVDKVLSSINTLTSRSPKISNKTINCYANISETEDRK